MLLNEYYTERFFKYDQDRFARTKKEELVFEPIPILEFKRRTGINGSSELEHSWGSAKDVVSLRELVSIEGVQLMPLPYLQKLLTNVVLAGGNRSRLYRDCTFETMRVSPRAVQIGQRFIEEKKVLGIMKSFRRILANFPTPCGIADMGPFIALGKTKAEKCAIAHYMPPIAEMNGGSKWALLDGIHRNSIVESTGGTTPIIAIGGVQEAFPCKLHGWTDINFVAEKPPPEERYFDLEADKFRNLKYVGIDG